MRRRTIGITVIVVAIAFVATWFTADQLLLVRQHVAGVIILEPGESFNFSFDVFPVRSRVEYSFTVQSGPEASVVIRSEIPYGDFYATSTPVSGADGLAPGVHLVVFHQNPDSSSTIRYDLTSVGYPGGSWGAGLYLASVVVILAFPLVLCAGILLILNASNVRPPEYCPYCGKRSGEWICPFCGLPRPIMSSSHKW